MNLITPNLTVRNAIKMLTIAWLLVLGVSMTAWAQTPSKKEPATPPPFYACKMTYALCVYSPCEGVALTGGQVTTTCTCPVLHDSWSVGAKDCEADKPEGDHVKSRYYPITKFARCSKPRAWAMCLDSDCKINESDKDVKQKDKKLTASCTCALMQGQGDFLYDAAKPEQCDSGIMSSATLDDLDGVTDWLQTQDQMPVFDFTVVNKQKK